LASGLPANFAASIFIVLHINRDTSSFLPAFLKAAGPLPAERAREGEPIVPGRIYVAPPNHHLLVERDQVRLSSGPQENRARPAVNALFRSAAWAYGPRVVGVVLGDSLDDGAAGLWEIKRRGGIAVARDPAESAFAQMPQNALSNVRVDYTTPMTEIAPLLVSLCEQDIEEEVLPALQDAKARTTNLTCPECHGPLQRIERGEQIEFRCRVGHTFSPRVALDAHGDAEERVLWSAVESLEEGADLASQLSLYLPDSSRRLEANARNKRALARRLRRMLVRSASVASSQGKKARARAATSGAGARSDSDAEQPVE
jgi:two-component system chemotaxis response regulator CheB